MLTLPIFYHVSTVITVDDDTLFLKAISPILNSNFLVKTIHQPTQCIEFFKDYNSPLSQINFLRSCTEHEHFDVMNHSFVDFDVPALQSLLSNPERNEEVSVIIVDYNMPEMNGIELCSKLNKLPIKKILLTGEAGSRDAVSAFNDNIIDRFIRKDSPSLASEIQTYVSTLSQQYYREKTSSLLTHLEVDKQMPLSDPLFAEFFQQWCKANRIKEYMLIDKNGSFIVLDKNNKYFYFIVHTADSLQSFIELNDNEAETEIEVDQFIKSVTQREKIPFFGIGKECWQFEPHSWHNYFYQPNILDGRERYYWTVIRHDGLKCC